MILPSGIGLLSKFWGLLKILFFVLKSSLGKVATAIVDVIKDVGITKLLAIWFMIGFVFRATWQVIFVDQNFFAWLFKVGGGLVLAEHELIKYTNDLITLNQTFGLRSLWDVLNIYIGILGAFFVFYYMVKVLSKFIAFILSNTSLGGAGCILLALGIIGFLELGFLLVIGLVSNGGNLDALTIEDITPGSGFITLGKNLDNVLHPFLAEETVLDYATQDINQTLQDTVIELNQSEQGSDGGFIKGTVNLIKRYLYNLW